MKKLFEKYEIKIKEEQLEKFEKYYKILVDYNKKVNLTAITEKEEVYIKHFIDSGKVVDKLDSYSLLDVGSGGGFPAIPIKILKDDIKITMLEATGKKCDFLSYVIKELELKDIEVVNGRAEELAKLDKYREKFDICTARAVARLNVLCEYCMPFVKVGGKFISLKGDAEEEINEAKNAINILGGIVDNVNNFLLEDAKRTIIEIKKIKNTPIKYPRGQGKERKKPL